MLIYFGPILWSKLFHSGSSFSRQSLDIIWPAHMVSSTFAIFKDDCLAPSKKLGKRRKVGRRYTGIPPHPQKVTWQWKQNQFEDVSPIKNGDFPASHVSFLEGIPFWGSSMGPWWSTWVFGEPPNTIARKDATNQKTGASSGLAGLLQHIKNIDMEYPDFKLTFLYIFVDMCTLSSVFSLFTFDNFFVWKCYGQTPGLELIHITGARSAPDPTSSGPRANVLSWQRFGRILSWHVLGGPVFLCNKLMQIDDSLECWELKTMRYSPWVMNSCNCYVVGHARRNLSISICIFAVFVEELSWRTII